MVRGIVGLDKCNCGRGLESGMIQWVLYKIMSGAKSMLSDLHKDS